MEKPIFDTSVEIGDKGQISIYVKEKYKDGATVLDDSIKSLKRAVENYEAQIKNLKQNIKSNKEAIKYTESNIEFTEAKIKKFEESLKSLRVRGFTPKESLDNKVQDSKDSPDK